MMEPLQASDKLCQWLLTKGTTFESLGHLVLALGRHLRTLGVPADRLYFGTLLLHPQAAAYYVVCEGDSGTSRDVEIPRAEYAAIEERQRLNPTPMSHILETGISLHARLMDRTFAGMPDLQSLKDQGYTDYYGLPLHHRGRPAAGLMVSTRDPSGFSEASIQILEACKLALGPVAMLYVQQMLQATLLQTYLGVDAGSRVQHGQVRRGDGQTIQAAIWFCDLRNFTHLSNEHDLQTVLDLLNQIFEVAVDAITEEQGQVLKFTGDGLLAIFPVKNRGKQQACKAALRAAQATQSQLVDLNQRRQARGLPTTSMGIGLHLGNVMYGNIGAPGRMDFTVIGPAVNLTARIQQVDVSTAHAAVMTETFAQVLPDPTTVLGDYELKGVPQAVAIHALA
jgi:adenylate cyclase